jgi:hypothetical protein
MYPTFHHDLATTRVADLDRHAARERTATAASRARSAQGHQRSRSSAGRTVTAIGYRVLMLLGACRPSPTR